MYLYIHTFTKRIFFSCWFESSCENHYVVQCREPMFLSLFFHQKLFTLVFLCVFPFNIAVFMKTRLFKISFTVGMFTRTHVLKAWCQYSSVRMWHLLGGIESWFWSCLEWINVSMTEVRLISKWVVKSVYSSLSLPSMFLWYFNKAREPFLTRQHSCVLKFPIPNKLSLLRNY